jgi:hypothetical protein
MEAKNIVGILRKASGHSPQRRSCAFYGEGVRERTMQDQKMGSGIFVLFVGTGTQRRLGTKKHSSVLLCYTRNAFADWMVLLESVNAN